MPKLLPITGALWYWWTCEESEEFSGVSSSLFFVISEQICRCRFMIGVWCVRFRVWEGAAKITLLALLTLRSILEYVILLVWFHNLQLHFWGSVSALLPALPSCWQVHIRSQLAGEYNHVFSSWGAKYFSSLLVETNGYFTFWWLTR